MYVDESGDPGLVGSSSRYFILSGLVIHESFWHDYLEELIAFRLRMKAHFGLPLYEEIHAANMIRSPGSSNNTSGFNLLSIKRNDRLTILRLFAQQLGSMTNFNIINIVVDKQGKPQGYDVFENSWKFLIQRFENTLKNGNFRGCNNQAEKGMIFPDATDVKKLTQLQRKMRRYNPIPNQTWAGAGYRLLGLRSIIEDPQFKDSKNSYFIQASDLAAYLLYQNLAPNSFMRKKSGQNYFNNLHPILCRVASSSNPLGIVRI